MNPGIKSNIGCHKILMMWIKKIWYLVCKFSDKTKLDYSTKNNEESINAQRDLKKVLSWDEKW